MKPKEVIILGIPYKIEYFDKPSDVDIYKRNSIWGAIDYWTRTIRVYDGGQPVEDLWVTIIHEVFHGIAEQLNMSLNGKENHDELGILAMALTDVLFRNKWIAT